MGNNFKGNNNHNKPSYFKENVMRSGEDFLSLKSAYDLERDAKKIIRDIVHGNINYATEGHFFTNTSLFQALVNTAYMEWATANYNFMGNCCLIQGGNKEEMLDHIMQYNMRRRDAYLIIWNALNSFGSTGDVRWLEGLRNQLIKYKSNI